MTGEFPRDEVRQILRGYSYHSEAWKERALDHLAALWPAPVPPHAIDRDVLDALLSEVLDEPQWSRVVIRNKILALVQPATGVTLTAEEARAAATAIRHRVGEVRYRARINPIDASVMGTDLGELRSLAEKLEAASNAAHSGVEQRSEQ